jgi:hypothetical protein
MVELDIWQNVPRYHGAHVPWLFDVTIVPFLFLSSLMVVGFEIRLLCLLGKGSTT